jgi:hypothetical protein
VTTSHDAVEAHLMKRAPLPGGRLRGGTHRSTSPISSSRRGDGSWPTGQGLLRGTRACPFSCGNRHRARMNHLQRRPVPFRLTMCGSAAALLAARQGDDRNIHHCLRGEFCRQGGLPQATTSISIQGGAVVCWVGLARASPATALRAATLAAPPPDAAATPVSHKRGEETCRSGAG